MPTLLVGAAALLVAAAGQPVSVKILAPLPSDTLVGKTEIMADISAPPDVSILKVEVYADDRLVTTLLDPPWRHVWDAGDSLRSRVIRVRAYASDGTAASDRVTTRTLVGAQHARVTLVEVYATVRDQQGAYLTDLKKEDFTVLESGAAQSIAVFTADRKPVHLVMLIDTSSSMRREARLDIAREAASGFVSALEPADAAALVAFSDAPRLLAESTSDKVALEAALQTLEARGGTALYDSLIAAVDLLKGLEGRKAIILLSDGRDESADGLGPGSTHTFEYALDAVLKSETAVYAIGTGENLEEEPDYERRRTVGEILGTLATRSGGRAYFIKRASKLKDAYRRIEDELRHQYTLAYYPAAEPAGAAGKDDGWRPIEVKVSRPRAKVTARSGYYAR